MDLFDVPALFQGKSDIAQTLGIRSDQALRISAGIEYFRRGRFAGFETPQAFRERLLERAADSHHFAHRFHLRPKYRLGAWEFFELPARDLHHYVVERRLKAGRRHW